jgi:uncharacterized membrane protein
MTVLQQHLDSAPPDDQTLASLWRTYAQHVGGRTIAQCIGFGMLGAIVPLFLGRATFVALVGVIVAAFGLYAAVVQPSLGARWLQPRPQRIIATAVTSIAALAGLAVGLLVLGTVFGGSIEVMRH